MKIIKFRGWVEDYGKMFSIKNMYFSVSGISVSAEWLNPITGKKCEYAFGVNKGIEIMQFVGLLDKNGKEIYEGDIVEWDGTNPETNITKKCRMAVIFEDQRWYPYLSKDMKIIGNIYENPDLLKGGYDNPQS